MSIKRMVTKLALAFAAKKGMDALKGMGGISGLQSAMGSTSTTPAQNTQRSGAPETNDGLGSILGSLCLGGTATNSDAGQNGSIGAILGSLSSAFGAPAAKADDELENQFNDTPSLNDEDAGPVLRAMVQMARADGSIDDDEQKALFDILDDAEPQEKATLTDALREPVDPRALAADTPPHARKEVYAAALLIGTPDTIAERDFLRALAIGLNFDQHDVDRLHSAMAKPRIVLA